VLADFDQFLNAVSTSACRILSWYHIF